MTVARRAQGALLPRRNVVAGTVLGVPLSALFLYLAARHVDAGAVVDAIGRADMDRLLLAVVFVAAMYVLQAHRWHRLARRDVSAGTGRFLRWVIGAVAVNNGVPGRPGDLLRVHWLAHRGGMSRGRALGTVFVDRGADVLALGLALGLGYSVAEHPSWLQRVDVGAAGLVGVLVAALLAARAYARRGSRHEGAVASRLRGAGRNVAEAVGDSVNLRDGAAVAALSVLSWASWGVAAWLVASSLGIGLSPLEVAFLTGVVNLGVAIPSSPGFVGTYQWLCVSALGLLAVGEADAFAFSVLMHAAWFVPTTLAGLGIVAWKGAVVWAGPRRATAAAAHAARATVPTRAS